MWRFEGVGTEPDFIEEVLPVRIALENSLVLSQKPPSKRNPTPFHPVQ